MDNLLADLMKRSSNIRFMFQVFADEYPHAVASGKEELWKGAVLSYIELITNNVKVNKNDQ